MRGGANFSVGIKYKPKPEMIGLEPHKLHQQNVQNQRPPGSQGQL